MPQGVRFTAWMSEEERRMIDELAAERSMSRNYIVRRAIRQFLGLEERQKVTDVTRNNRNTSEVA